MKKHIYKMTTILFSLCIFASSVFTTGCNDKNEEVAFTPTYPQYTPYTEADIWTAYQAFNDNLLDPTRKLYWRDTDRSASDANKVGAIWTQAIYWDMTMYAYKKNPTEENLQHVKDVYQGNKNYYANFDWHHRPDVWFIYDDIMWWVISLARGYEITQDPEYLAFAESGFDRVWNGSTLVGDQGSYADPEKGLGGGMFWAWNQTTPSTPMTSDNAKMSCINYPTVIAAMTLFNITGNTDYLDKAKEIYEWSRNNLYNSSTGNVADSRHGKKEPDWSATVYNQGTCIGAALLLYDETNEEQYLKDAIKTADYTRNVMSAPYDILPYRAGEEQGIYTAIFAQYIAPLIYDQNQSQYLIWMRRTINYGWKFRDANRNLTIKDYKTPASATDAISCYDASGIPALMLVIPADPNDLGY